MKHILGGLIVLSSCVTPPTEPLILEYHYADLDNECWRSESRIVAPEWWSDWFAAPDCTDSIVYACDVDDRCVRFNEQCLSELPDDPWLVNNDDCCTGTTEEVCVEPTR
jgi:hypothetical protein